MFCGFRNILWSIGFLLALTVVALAKPAIKNKLVYLEPGGLVSYEANNYALGPTLRIYCYNGTEKTVGRMFETIELQLDIEGTDFRQYEGADALEVLTHYEEHRSLFSFTLFSQKRTRLQLSPFEQQCIGIETAQPYILRMLQLRVDFWRVIQVGIALLLFFNASRLSHNSFFYYITGVVMGVCCSFMLLIWLSSKLLPRRSMMYGAVIGGWTIGVYIVRLLWENLQTLVLTYRNFIIWYILVTGVVSFFFCYRWGPPKNKRSKLIIKWVLQLMSIALLYIACSFEEVAFAIMMIIVVIHYFPISIWRRLVLSYQSRFPQKRRLLTNQEYYEQAVRETGKALEQLREFARSPDCPQWKVIQKLRNPMRFAQFVEGGSHLQEEEILSFENNNTDESEQENVTDQSEEESEMETSYTLTTNISPEVTSPLGRSILARRHLTPTYR